MRVLITGDREWGNAETWGRQEAERQVLKLKRTLTALFAVAPDTILVHGGARGADSIAGVMWSALAGAEHVECHPADWTKYHKAAGPIRNQFMIDESARRAATDGHRLEKAVACHTNLAQSKGTKDMVTRLHHALGAEHILYLT